MRHSRSVNRLATAINGFAIAAALLRADRIAIALIAASVILLVRNLEALRTPPTRETRS